MRKPYLFNKQRKVGQVMDNIYICESFCAWVDLLGYGSAFYSSNWDIRSPSALNNLKRIQMLEHITTSIRSPLNETLFSLNDGFIRNFDIPKSYVTEILGWLIDVILKFKLINEQDIQNGYYGARGVMAYGSRAQYRQLDSLGKGDFILTSPEKKQEYNKKRIVLTPSELQMNTAFSKAYIIESGGSRSGLKNNKLHIDEKLLIKLAETINAIGSDEFGSIDEDYEKNGPCIYRYKADFFNESKSFIVKANCNGTEWDCFRMDFDNVISYENERQSLTTHLYTPYKVFDSIYSPYDSGEFEL